MSGLGQGPLPLQPVLPMSENTLNDRATDGVDGQESAAVRRSCLFRGDDNYQGGPVGKAIGEDADGADIQSSADHVLRKESSRSSRFTSFTTETKIARRFTTADDNRHVRKVEMTRLLALESQGAIKLWTPDSVFETLTNGPKKLAKQAADVRAAMRRNCEVLIEGRMPAGVLDAVS